MSETILFERWKETLIKRYGHGDSNHEFVVQAHANLIEAYGKFIASGCADPHFIQEICSTDSYKSAQRLGEMLLYERLNHALPSINISSKSNGPDFRIEIDGKPAWLELVTPSIGDDIRITELQEAYNPLFPCPDAATELRERHLLRVTSAIASKLEAYEKYIAKEIVPPDQPLIIVINDSLLCGDLFGYGVYTGPIAGVSGSSLASEAVHGLGHSIWVKEQENGNYELQQTYREEVKNRPEPTGKGHKRKPVQVNLFSTQKSESTHVNRAKIISAVMQLTLREDHGLFMHFRNHAETQDRLLDSILPNNCVMVINPTATNKIDRSLIDLFNSH